MCPACWSTLALIAAGAGSAGGLAAVVVRRIRTKPGAEERVSAATETSAKKEEVR